MSVSVLRVVLRAATFQKGFLASSNCLVSCLSKESIQPKLQACRFQHDDAFRESLPQQVRRLSKEAAGKADHLGHLSDSGSDSDSDSELGRGHEKATSEFWRRKIRTFHSLIDLNHDGIVSFDDFKILADRFISLGHLSAQQQREFTAMLREVWEEQWGVIHPYNMVTAEQYLESMHHVLNDKSLKRKAHRFLPYLFKAVDKDKNGTISVEEFKLFFECLDLSTDDAVHSFEAIDLNHDGALSLEEFVRLGREYFVTEDERKPSRMFWGPLAQP